MSKYELKIRFTISADIFFSIAAASFNTLSASSSPSSVVCSSCFSVSW